MTSDNRDPVRVLGRVNVEQWNKWKKAAASAGMTFTDLAKSAIDLHCQLIKIKLAEVEPQEGPPKEPRRKLPKQLQNKGPRKKHG
jgi:hypothetical protein